MAERLFWLVEYVGMDGVEHEYTVHPTVAVESVDDIESRGGHQVRVTDEQGLLVFENGEWDETCLPGSSGSEIAGLKN